MQIGSPVKIAPHMIARDELKVHMSRVFRVYSMDEGSNGVTLHSIGGNPLHPVMVFGMDKSELVQLKVKQ